MGYPNMGYPNMGFPNRILMSTNRSMLTYILLNIITCGIYSLVFYSKLGEDLNLMASRRDGKKTMHFCLVYFLLGPITCGIYLIVWYHCLCARIGEEAQARGINTGFGASTFWLWNVLGAFLCGIGPFIFLYKLCETMNLISHDYNQRGI